MAWDLKKTLPSFAATVGRIDAVDVPLAQYLAVDAEGDPNTSESFRAAIETVFPLAYTVKFMSKTLLDRDYVVPPMEALWWSDDMASFAEARHKSRWKSTVLIMLPEWITLEHVETARQKAAAKVPSERLAGVQVLDLLEGPCVQTLYVGPYDDEGPVIAEMHRAIRERGAELTGKHHEIYLSDSRRTPPERLRTIIRQPFAPG